MCGQQEPHPLSASRTDGTASPPLPPGAAMEHLPGGAGTRSAREGTPQSPGHPKARPGTARDTPKPGPALPGPPGPAHPWSAAPASARRGCCCSGRRCRAPGRAARAGPGTAPAPSCPRCHCHCQCPALWEPGPPGAVKSRPAEPGPPSRAGPHRDRGRGFPDGTAPGAPPGQSLRWALPPYILWHRIVPGPALGDREATARPGARQRHSPALPSLGAHGSCTRDFPIL